MRLKAIATERAPAIATTIQAILIHRPSRGKPASRHASSAPVRAKGSAKTECSNLIMSSVRRRRLRKGAKTHSTRHYAKRDADSFTRGGEPWAGALRGAGGMYRSGVVYLADRLRQGRSLHGYQSDPGHLSQRDEGGRRVA